MKRTWNWIMVHALWFMIVYKLPVICTVRSWKSGDFPSNGYLSDIMQMECTIINFKNINKSGIEHLGNVYWPAYPWKHLHCPNSLLQMPWSLQSFLQFLPPIFWKTRGIHKNALHKTWGMCSFANKMSICHHKQN